MDTRCLVLPGVTASYISTRPLRTYLKVLGYAAHGWKRRPNHGPRPGVEAGMDARLADLWRLYQRKVTLIGWSLGGVFAREIARRATDLVRQVVMLASDAWRLAEMPRKRRSMTGRVVKSRSYCRRPSTAIHSRTDVDWKRRSRTSANSPKGSAGAQHRAEGPARTRAGESRQSAEIAAAEVALRGRKGR